MSAGRDMTDGLAITRDAFEKIAADIGNKTVEQVKTYAKTFWERYQEVAGKGYQVLSSYHPQGTHAIP